MKEYICKDDLYKLFDEEVVHVDQVNKCLIRANRNTFTWDEVVLPTVTKSDICVEMIEFVTSNIIYPLLNEYDIGLWRHIDYIPLAEKWVEAVQNNPGDDETVIEYLKNWISEQLKEQVE